MCFCLYRLVAVVDMTCWPAPEEHLPGKSLRFCRYVKALSAKSRTGWYLSKRRNGCFTALLRAIVITKVVSQVLLIVSSRTRHDFAVCIVRMNDGMDSWIKLNWNDKKNCHGIVTRKIVTTIYGFNVHYLTKLACRSENKEPHVHNFAWFMAACKTAGSTFGAVPECRHWSLQWLKGTEIEAYGYIKMILLRSLGIFNKLLYISGGWIETKIFSRLELIINSLL